MHPEVIKENIHFIGREEERGRLAKLDAEKGSKILIVYGRRRVGKTELLEQFFRHRNILKFEGLEGQSDERQRQHVMEQLAKYTDEPLLKKIEYKHWIEVFECIARYVIEGEWTVYFEEIQWLANYKHDFIAELKHVWDNQLRRNDKLLLILCGSSPSFVINKILHSKALHNRSLNELLLREFNPITTAKFLKGKSKNEILDAYLTIGGMPEYLLRMKKHSSTLISIVNESFKEGGFFLHEYKRVFTSSLGKTEYAQKIIEFLSRRRFATRDEILSHLKLTSGGGVTDLLNDLEQCGFISKYTPYYLEKDSLLCRYCITDAYLQFYFKFIKPLTKRILSGEYNREPMRALNIDSYYKWLGYAFERVCRKYHYVIARILGFSGVDYQFGTYFNRQSQFDAPGYQLDLVFARKDKVYTICEMKYLQTKVSHKVIEEMARKLEYFPPAEKHTIQKVLVAPQGASETVINQHYFDRIITMDELFNENYWRC
ncbi:MAG: hypothetical protein A3F17_09370 [Gammaproteobacteria bacterium RIFCSPHIGHO2_12_FULL_41_15]|nr:MAG: hypothetical protein A3F17_09370 [Gammaproteobacteria bacterium RIFCSPHIGHO2_12_FULL_41_15]